MAAEGAVAAYEQIVGERWKPFERQIRERRCDRRSQGCRSPDGGARLSQRGRGFGPASPLGALALTKPALSSTLGNVDAIIYIQF
ncbi:hypothetical protein C8J31_11851 [Rhizobium sp. PP-CC-2G-626]|nr:hypothetical protein C8J31_11851 [Rhizobium sp. PP-CC-2G-626]